MSQAIVSKSYTTFKSSLIAIALSVTTTTGHTKDFSSPASNPGLDLKCEKLEAVTLAQFEGVVRIAEAATKDSPEVSSVAEFDLTTIRKVIEGPNESPVVREITERVSTKTEATDPVPAKTAHAQTSYIPAGQLFSHEAIAVEIVFENGGIKTSLRSIPESQGMNSTLIHNGLQYRARCIR